MVNRARGEVPLMIEGRPHRLCLTLGALAEMEAGLGAADLKALEGRLAQPRMSDIIVILAALLRGGGHDIADAELAKRQLDLKAAGAAIAAAFLGHAAGLGQKDSPHGSAPGEAPAPPATETAPGGAGFL